MAAQRVLARFMIAAGKMYEQEAGFVAEKLFKQSGSIIVVYLAAEQGLDVSGRYAVVCSKHGNIVGDTSLQRAKMSMREPTQFCPDCEEAAARG